MSENPDGNSCKFPEYPLLRDGQTDYTKVLGPI
jgi:hypothetical protein